MICGPFWRRCWRIFSGARLGRRKFTLAPLQPRPKPLSGWWMFGDMLLLILLGLPACSTTGSSDASVNPCRLLVVKQYSDAAQISMGREVRAAPAGAQWVDWVIDYGTLRSEVRACRGEK